jgi:protein PhnA
MSTRHHLHKERQDAIANLGRDLTRRSKAKCELCNASGKRLFAMEVEPLPHQPDTEHSVFLCERCSDDMARETLDPTRWHFLESLVWSEIAPVQVTAVRLCRRLQDQGVDWAEDVLSNLYLSPEIEAWL